MCHGTSGACRSGIFVWGAGAGVARQGADPQTMTPAESAAYIKAEVVKWAKVVKASAARSIERWSGQYVIGMRV